MPNPLYNPKRWEPLDAPIKNAPGARSPEKLLAIAAQFDVEVNPRYERTVSSTFCNIYAWDVTRAMGAELPHWIHDNGDIGTLGHDRETTCNSLIAWLENHGPRHGWTEVARGSSEAARRCRRTNCGLVAEPDRSSRAHRGGAASVGERRHAHRPGGQPQLLQRHARPRLRGSDAGAVLRPRLSLPAPASVPDAGGGRYGGILSSLGGSQ
jgi:hypothetical protein